MKILKAKKNKALLIMALCGALNFLGCSKNEVKNTEVIEKEQDDTEVYNDKNTQELNSQHIDYLENSDLNEVDIEDDLKLIRSNLIESLKISQFDSNIKDFILNIINNGTGSDLKYVELTLKENDIDHLTSIILDNSAHLELNEYYEENFLSSDIIIYDNRTAKQDALPHQVCLFAKANEYGYYQIYQLRSSGFEWKYLITRGNVMFGYYEFNFNEIKLDFFDNDEHVLTLDEYLNKIGLKEKSKKEYRVYELKSLLNSISEKVSINNHIRKIYVIDTTNKIDYPRLDIAESFYIVREICPFVFDKGTMLCKDIYHDQAFVKVFLNAEIELVYEDYTMPVDGSYFYMDSEDDIDLIELNEFLIESNLDYLIKKKYTDDDLLDILDIIMNERSLNIEDNGAILKKFIR